MGRAGVFFLVLLTLFWDSALAILLVDMIRGALPNWVPVLIWFAIPGGLVGLGFLGLSAYAAFREFPVLLGVRPTRVEVSAHPLHPGGSYEIAIAQPGPLRLQALRVVLVCEERVTTREGTSTRTETKTVYQDELLRRGACLIERGRPYTARRPLRLPAEASPSFRAESSGVAWKVVVTGQSATGWPGFSFEFPVIVTGATGERPLDQVRCGLPLR
jgi:hypothetical protein